jgi:hypothetical protein
MTIAVSQQRNARRPCRSSIGHGADYSDRQLRPPSNSRSSINAPPRGRNDLLGNCIVVDPSAPSTCHNAHTASATPKSP